MALKIWFADRRLNDSIGFRNCWGFATSIAQINMKWYYNWDEVQARLNQKIGNI